MALNKNKGSRDDNRGKYRGPEQNRFGGPGAEPPTGVGLGHGNTVTADTPQEGDARDRGQQPGGASRPAAVSDKDLIQRKDKGDTRK